MSQEMQRDQRDKLGYAYTCNSTKMLKKSKGQIGWIEMCILCQNMHSEQRNVKRSKRQIGWVGSSSPAIWDKVCQSLHVVQCALLWAQFVMEKGLLKQIDAILLCSCLQHIQTIVWTLVSPICEKDTWQIHVITHFCLGLCFKDHLGHK